jgi:hypothetical protein
VQRLRELERSGIVKREQASYRLTAAGEALRPLVEQMGLWAQRWCARTLSEHDLDDSLLVWSLHRSLKVPPHVTRRVVLRFDFHGLPRSLRLARRSWWLLAQGGEVEICIKDPGYEVDVILTADLRSLMEVVLARRSLRSAQRSGQVKLQGDSALVRELPGWLPLNGELAHTMGIVAASP